MKVNRFSNLIFRTDPMNVMMYLLNGFTYSTSLCTSKEVSPIELNRTYSQVCIELQPKALLMVIISNLSP